MILLENDAVGLTPREMGDLLEYSTSLPTGQTPGKAWKRRSPPWAPANAPGVWSRGVYGKPYPEGHEHHGQIPIGWRRIVVLGQEPTAYGIRVAPPRMRGRIVEWDGWPEGLFAWKGGLAFDCLSCGQTIPLDVEVEEYDPKVAYCGGSPRCLP